MSKNPYLDRMVRRDWLVDGPLRDYISRYTKHLTDRRYVSNTIGVYLKCLAHFSFWMTKHGLTEDHVNKDLVQNFLRKHLRSCHCPEPCYSHVKSVRAALHQLIAIFPQPESTQRDPLTLELEQFDKYLLDVCGLAANTRFYRRRHIELFLSSRFGRHKPDITQLTIDDLDSYFLNLSKRWKPSSCMLVRTNLRSYFRYRATCGDDTRALVNCLPNISSRNSRLPPKILSNSQITAFENAINRNYPVGLRDYAIARCLLDLGLRGDEVTHLTLDDIDWANGIVTLKHTKSRRAQQLPLPVRTGEAISQYLRNGRPKSDSRFVFIRHRAPFGVPLGVPAIRNAMNGAFRRCGLSGQFCNTHVLRRSMATRLLKSGASFKEIADVLRHQDLNTARVYTRVDLEGLRSCAQAWIGEQP